VSQLGALLAPHLCFCGNSGFDSALYRKLDAERHFSQENATLHEFKMATVESKPL
jgi:hypothetical protein